MKNRTSYLDEIIRKRKERLEKERKEILERVKNALLRIREKYGIKEAYILGTLVRKNAWGENSDVDGAVGGASMHILSIMKEIEDVVNREVDVVDLDAVPVPDGFRRKGLRVYG